MGWIYVAAAVLLAVAFLTKQSHLAAIAALTVVALGSQRWARAVGLVSTWSALVGAAVVILQLASDGLFAANVLAPNVLPMSAELALRHGLPFVLLGLPLLLLAWIGWRGRASSDALLVVKWYALFAATLESSRSPRLARCRTTCWS